MTEFSVPQDVIDGLRQSGLAIVPLKPTEDMIKVGAPSCFQAYEGTWEHACSDAKECYAAMIEVGAL